jgi:hypothetical protein
MISHRSSSPDKIYPEELYTEKIFHLYMICPEEIFHREDLSSVYNIHREALSQR